MVRIHFSACASSSRSCFLLNGVSHKAIRRNYSQHARSIELSFNQIFRKVLRQYYQCKILCAIYHIGLWEFGARSWGLSARLPACSPSPCLCQSSCPTSITSIIVKPTKKKCNLKISITLLVARTCPELWANHISVSIIVQLQKTNTSKAIRSQIVLPEAAIAATYVSISKANHYYNIL